MQEPLRQTVEKSCSLQANAKALVAAYHQQRYHSGVTVVSQWCHSGIAAVPYYQHPLVKIYRGSCQNLSKYKKYRCDAVVMRW